MPLQRIATLGEADREGLCRRRVAYWDRVDPDPSHREHVDSGGLMISGPVGVGKTWLAAAVAADWFLRHRYIAAGYVNCRPGMAWVTSPEMLRRIRDSYGSTASERETIEAFTSPGLLVIDDLGKEQATPWAVSRLWEVVDEIIREPGHSLIVTTQYDPGDLGRRLAEKDGEGTARAIVSRLSTLHPVRLAGHDRRISR